MTEEQIQLAKEQSELDDSGGAGGYTDSSLHDTLLMLLSTGNHGKAEKLRKQFKISDRRLVSYEC